MRGPVDQPADEAGDEHRAHEFHTHCPATGFTVVDHGPLVLCLGGGDAPIEIVAKIVASHDHCPSIRGRTPC